MPAAPAPRIVPPPAPCDDLRFRALLPPGDWLRLPPAVRRRFSKRLTGLATAVYRGEVLETRMSRLGWCLAQAARLIGGPLPVTRDAHVPAVVTVTEDARGGGQFWTRQYGRARGFPQVIHSSKRFSGPTGLEEYVGCGIGMALTIHVEDGALLFRCAHYFIALGGCRVRLPSALTPGALTVSHAACDDGRFIFGLELAHPRFGELIRQTAVFQDALQLPGEAG